MPTAQDVAWFKSQFQEAIAPALAGTPFSVDMITAIACQETGGIWPILRRKGLSTERILQLCVGDTIDASATGGRRAFPKNKAELLGAADGGRMFELARQGLVDMAGFIPGYSGAAARPDKFCRGFGIFQLDLQFFRTDPAYFLERRYADFGHALQRCIGELRAALKRIGFQGKTTLSDHEMAAVAIAYNTGRFNPAKGLKQGYFDGTKYYGENFFGFLQLAHSVQVPPPAPVSRGARARPPLANGREPSRAAPRRRAVATTNGATATKTAVKKTTARKATAKKTTAKKKAAKGVTAKKATARKATAKKATARKATAKKATARKPAAPGPVARKVAAKRTAARNGRATSA
jgi:hypothetical protein